MFDNSRFDARNVFVGGEWKEEHLQSRMLPICILFLDVHFSSREEEVNWFSKLAVS